jgi:hypothetical protein
MERSAHCFCARAGLPKAVAPAGTSRVTTLPAPISASSPMLTPGRMIAPPPIQTLRPMRMGRPNSKPAARSAGSRGWSVANLRGRANLRSIAYGDGDDIEDHAVEVEKDPSAERDIEAVIAMKRRPDHGTLADKGEAFHQQLPPFGRRSAERRVVAHKPAVCCRQCCLKLRVASVVQLAGEHLVLLSAHRAPSAWFGPLAAVRHRALTRKRPPLLETTGSTLCIEARCAARCSLTLRTRGS